MSASRPYHLGKILVGIQQSHPHLTHSFRTESSGYPQLPIAAVHKLCQVPPPTLSIYHKNECLRMTVLTSGNSQRVVEKITGVMPDHGLTGRSP